MSTQSSLQLKKKLIKGVRGKNYYRYYLGGKQISKEKYTELVSLNKIPNKIPEIKTAKSVKAVRKVRSDLHTFLETFSFTDDLVVHFVSKRYEFENPRLLGFKIISPPLEKLQLSQTCPLGNVIPAIPATASIDGKAVNLRRTLFADKVDSVDVSDVSDVSTPNSVPLKRDSKTIPCRHVLRGLRLCCPKENVLSPTVRCPYGNRCHFSHGPFVFREKHQTPPTNEAEPKNKTKTELVKELVIEKFTVLSLKDALSKEKNRCYQLHRGWYDDKTVSLLRV